MSIFVLYEKNVLNVFICGSIGVGHLRQLIKWQKVENYVM